jgi:hypothetical protein
MKLRIYYTSSIIKQFFSFFFWPWGGGFELLSSLSIQPDANESGVKALSNCSFIRLISEIILFGKRRK